MRALSKPFLNWAGKAERLSFDVPTLPLFVHEREAHDQMLQMVDAKRDRLPPTVIHCFTGTAAEARAYIDRGLYIGLTG